MSPSKAKVNTPSGDAAGLRQVACQRCRARRSFCSKELPKCSRCRANSLDCVYAGSRKITISESYLRNLEERLKAFEEGAALPSPPAENLWRSQSIEETAESDVLSNADGGGIEEIDQGVHSVTIDSEGRTRPQYTGPADATASTRRLSSLLGLGGAYDVDFAHSPLSAGRAALRISRLPVITGRLPPIQVARRWYDAHYSYIGTIFAFSTREWFDDQLVNAYTTGPPDVSSNPETCLGYAKLLIILAFGRLYSVNQGDYDGPPGIELLQDAVQFLPSMHEAGSILFVETLSLVGYYMANLGERDAAFLYVGAALRMAISLALHREVRSIQMDDAEKERRRRVWWSVYSMDRILTIKSGNPIMIQDEDIAVESPSKLPEEAAYGPWIVLLKYTELSKILARISREVYQNHQQAGANLMASVQSILSALSAWSQDLPPQLLFHPDKLNFSRESVSTFLHYYQCINMAVRPLLFLMVERRLKWTVEQRMETDWRHELSAPTIGAIERCISTARDTIAMISIAVQKNLYATYGFMDGEHLFSACLVLVLVCLALPFTEQDYNCMDNALRMVQLLVDRGNSTMGPRLQLLQQVRSFIVPPPGVTLPAQLTTNSNAVFEVDLSSFPQVNNVALGDLWLDSAGSADHMLWEEGYNVAAESSMEYDLLQWAQPVDGTWTAEHA